MKAKQITMMLAGVLIVSLGIATVRHSNHLQQRVASEEKQIVDEATSFAKDHGGEMLASNLHRVGDGKVLLTSEVSRSGKSENWVFRYSAPPRRLEFVASGGVTLYGR